MAQKQQNKPAPNQKQTKLQPTLLKYLINNIEKGVLPTKDELLEIQQDLGTSWLADINLALLKHIENAPVASNKPSRATQSEAVIEMVKPKVQAPTAAPKRQPLPEDRALTPADLRAGSVIGKRRD